jgi:hypothetical protein
MDVVICRQPVRQIAAGLQFSVTGQTMLVTAASELARNTLIHGGGGRFLYDELGSDSAAVEPRARRNGTTWCAAPLRPLLFAEFGIQPQIGGLDTPVFSNLA